MEITECPRPSCRGPQWLGRLDVDGREIFVACCSDCGAMSRIEGSREVIDLIELLDRDREAGLFETDETVEEWLRRRLEELEGRE